MRIEFFESAADFRSWLQANHRKERELAVGFCRKNSGRPSITYSEAVDEALCFGWIDGVRNRIDAETYRVRFTPRKPRSRWSGQHPACAQADSTKKDDDRRTGSLCWSEGPNSRVLL